jgi:glycosyltransferase involved in cell wall biosynthesis
MKILLINTASYPNIGGVENSLNYIAKELINQSHEVIIVSFDSIKNEVDYIEHNGVWYYKIPLRAAVGAPMRLFYLNKAVKKEIGKIIEDFKPNEIWSRSALLSFCVKRLNLNIPITQIYATTAWLHTKGTYFTKDKLGVWKRIKFVIFFLMDFPTMFLIEQFLVTRTKSVVFSDLMVHQLNKNYKNIKKLLKIPPGIDHSIFSIENASKYDLEFNKKYPMLKDGYLLYVGRLSSAKNIDLLIEGYGKSELKYPLVLVGSGSHQSFLESKVNTLGIDKNVFFVGKQTDLLPSFYTNAKLTILPSTIETFGQVIIESMACGTPVMGFGRKEKYNNGILTAFSEIIVNGRTGVEMNEVSIESIELGVNNFLKTEIDYKSNCIKESENYFWGKFIKKMINAV